MKKTLSFLLIFFSYLTIIAQGVGYSDVYDQYPRQIGLRIGLNSTTFNSSKSQLQNVSADASAKFGWSGNFAYWFPITSLFRPRIELSYDVLNANVDYLNIYTNKSTFRFEGSAQLSQGSFALMPEWVFGKHIQFSAFFGLQVSILMAAHERGVQTAVDSSATVKSVVEIDHKDNTIAETFDSGFLAGMGVRYRLVKSLYINAEARVRFGTSMVYGIYKPYYWGISAGCIYTL